MKGILHNQKFDLKTVRRSHDYVETEKGVKLKIINFIPKKVEKPPVLFIPGWVTVIEKFYSIIKSMNINGYPVHYIEFRDKKSSRFKNKHLTYKDFMYHKYFEDLDEIIKHYNLICNSFYMFGSSKGAALILKYLTQVKEGYRPKKTILMIPAFNLHFHSWQKMVIRTPMTLKPLLIKFVEWYLRMAFSNPNEPDLAYQFSEKLVEVDVNKVQLSAIAIDKENGFKLKQSIKNLDDDIMIVGAENDLMHPEWLIRNFAKYIRNGTYLNLVSNKFTHNELMGKVASRFFASIDFKNILPLELRKINFQGK